MGYLDPLIPAIPALILGFSLVTYLATRAERRLPAVAGIIMFILAIGVGFYSIPWGMETFLAIPLCAGMMVVGYLAGAYSLMSIKGRKRAEITRSPDDMGDGHTAVVYVSHEEPGRYAPKCWIERFNELDEKGIETVPVLSRPMYLRRVRAQYREGGDPIGQVHLGLVQRIEEVIRREGDQRTTLHMASLEGDPRPDEAVVQAINAGASRIVVLLALLTESDYSQRTRETVGEVQFPIEVRFTGPLWDSNELMEVIVERADRELMDDDRRNIGVLMVGRGRPEEWDQEYPGGMEQERLFMEGALSRLEQAGYERGNMGMAWIEFRQPEMMETLREMAERGFSRILCFSMAIDADCVFSLRELPRRLEAAELPRNVRVIHIEAWEDHPSVGRALLRRLKEQM